MVVIFFYYEATNIDVDGIAKLILDAIEGSVIEDDNLISQVLVRKTDRNGLVLTNPPAPLPGALATYASFVYVCLNDAPDHTEVPT